MENENYKYFVTQEKNIDYLYKRFKNKDKFPGAIEYDFYKKMKIKKNLVTIKFNENDFLILKDGKIYSYEEWQEEKNSIYLLFDEKGLNDLYHDLYWLAEKKYEEDFENNIEFPDNEMEDYELVGVKINDIKNYAKKISSKYDSKINKDYYFKIVVDEKNRLLKSQLLKAQGFSIKNEEKFSLEFLSKAISRGENLAQVEVEEIDYSPLKDKDFKIKMYIGGTGSGKTYKAINESDNFVIITPTRQLAYEFIMDYPEKIDTIATGEIHIEGERNAVMVYENLTTELLKKYDKLIIDEAHWINDENRGTHLIELMIEAIKQNKEIQLLTATDTLSNELKNIFNIETQELKPYKEVKKLEIQTEYEIRKMAEEGKIGIVFTKYVPDENDMEYYSEKFGINIEDIATLSADDPTSERLKKQIAFRKGDIKLLLATNVVAQGNNFPADYVVIEYNEYDTWELVEQKIGRAGRPQFTNVGYYYLNYRPPKYVPENAPKEKVKAEVTFYRGIYIGNWEKKFEIHEVPDPEKMDSYRNIKYSKRFLETLIDKDLANSDEKKAFNFLLTEEEKTKKIIEREINLKFKKKMIKKAKILRR